MSLKTDYQDDVLNAELNTKRKYRMIHNDDGTVSFEDVTQYIQTGTSFGSEDVNNANVETNAIRTLVGNTELQTIAKNLTEGVNELNSKIGYRTIRHLSDIGISSESLREICLGMPNFSVFTDIVSPATYPTDPYNANAGMVPAYGMLKITKSTDSRIEIEYTTSEPATYKWIGSSGSIADVGINLQMHSIATIVTDNLNQLRKNAFWKSKVNNIDNYGISFCLNSDWCVHIACETRGSSLKYRIYNNGSWGSWKSF